MNVGMLWFDNDPSVLMTAKVARAAKYYENKYGSQPTLCFVHPSMIPLNGNGKSNGNGRSPKSAGHTNEKEEILMAGSVEIRSNRTILPNHFWMGVNGKPDNGAKR
jgi:hypothetical protein